MSTRRDRVSANLQNLVISAQPTEAEILRIESQLESYGQEKTGGKLHYPGTREPGLEFSLAVAGPDGEVVGGVTVSSLLGVMWLEVLWTAALHRRRGIASWLILEAERIAYDKGCVGAGTWTFDWQGAEFYPRIGYRLNGIYDGYPLGITEHVLSKSLPSTEDVLQAVAARARANEQDGYTLVSEPTREEMGIVGRGLHEHCAAHAGDEMSNPGVGIKLALRTSDGECVGGLVASTTIRVVALEQLWVDERFRGQGHGRALVAEAERIGKDHRCVAVQGSCLSFQSPAFFDHLGYQSFGRVEAYLDGVWENLLTKRL
jgi:GNAT superfamily N-acetyltransferase